MSFEFTTPIIMLNHATFVSGAWASANDPVAIPFVLSQAGVVTQLGWVNGSSAGGNVDVGVYSSSWVRLISTGSTAGSGNSAWQFVDVADTALPPGRYYLVMARDNTTANRVSSYASLVSAPLLALAGVQDTTTNSFPLPNPLTNMAEAATFTRIPICGIVMGATR